MESFSQFLFEKFKLLSNLTAIKINQSEITYSELHEKALRLASAINTLKDNRNEIEYKYRIPELTPSGSNIAIQGNFDIKISGTGITDESSSQKVDYDIYVKDRAANKSNTITTSSITIQQ